MNNKFSTKLKTTATIILILLMASVTLMAMPAQPVQAQIAAQQPVSGPLSTGVTVDWTFAPVAYLSFTPNPVGVGQTILVNMWNTPPPAANRFLAGYKVTITKPDSTQEVITMDSYVADGTAWFEYVADQLGTWKLKFEFPGEYFPAGRYYNGYIVTNTSGTVYSSQYYKPSSTAEQTLTVQEEQVLSWHSPLPTDYWTRPISLENREWYVIGGNYPWMKYYGGGMMSGAPRYMGPYITAPNTAHIVWKRLGALAGLIGGEAGQYGTTSSPSTPSVIYAGRCYQTMTIPVNGVPTSCAVCYDLRTGEIYYAIPISQGGVTPTQISYSKAETGAVPGSGADQPYVATLMSIGARLIKINPYTGAVTTNVTGLTIGAAAMVGSVAPTLTGTFYNGYVLTVQTINATTGDYRLLNWTTAGTETNFTRRIVSNISYPINSIGIADLETGITVSREGRMVFGDVAGTGFVAVSLTTGKVLWNITTWETAFNPGTAVSDYGKFAYGVENRYWRCLDEYSGKELWKTELTSYPWGNFWGYSVCSAYGMIYAFCYDGVYAFNWTNGKTVWHYVHPAPPYETPYTLDDSPVYSMTGGGFIADGKLYCYNSEHTPTAPYPRGWKLHCINATTGEGLWNITYPMTPGAAADGYLTAASSYDGYIYVFGKGQSATTVSAPQTAITQGQSIVLTGAVLDQSPAQIGKACVSADSMATYMEYLHMQKPIDGIWHNETITGVPVSIDAVDPNGNYVHIADVTSDVSGTFSYMWTPDLAGKYTVTATFMGDDSYGSSWAETAVGIVNAPQASATPTATPIAMPPFELYTVGTGIAVIIAVAIVGLLILRKRP